MLLDSATVSLVVVRCVILPWRWEVQMEAVVDMTPRLRIPSSSRRKQRSLSPSHPLFFLSLCWNVPLYSLFPLPVYPPPMLWAPIQTPTSSPHLPKWPLASPKISHLLVCAWNNEEADTHKHTRSSYPTVPPYSHPRVQVEKKHSTTAWRSSADEAKRACREAQARSASLKPIRPVEFSRFSTNRRPQRTQSRTSNELLSAEHIWYLMSFTAFLIWHIWVKIFTRGGFF